MVSKGSIFYFETTNLISNLGTLFKRHDAGTWVSSTKNSKSDWCLLCLNSYPKSIKNLFMSCTICRCHFEFYSNLFMLIYRNNIQKNSWPWLKALFRFLELPYAPSFKKAKQDILSAFQYNKSKKDLGLDKNILFWFKWF